MLSCLCCRSAAPHNLTIPCCCADRATSPTSSSVCRREGRRPWLPSSTPTLGALVHVVACSTHLSDDRYLRFGGSNGMRQHLSLIACLPRYRHDFIGAAAGILCGFIITFGLVVILALRFLNFNKR